MTWKVLETQIGSLEFWDLMEECPAMHMAAFSSINTTRTWIKYLVI